MTCLILDTSGDQAVLALADRGICFLQKIISEGRQLSKFLLPSIQQILQDKNPDFIAIGIGPGSFTGTRVGAMVAKTLAYAWKVPLVTFSSLELPNLDTIADQTYKKFLENQTCHQIELVYIPATP